jgi:hypothetical protein
MILRREHAVPAILVSIIVVVAAVLVALSLRRPTLTTHLPTPPDPRERGEARVGPALHTLDARSSRDWVYFDFSRASTVHDPGPLEWDLAFRRFHVMVNGGEGFSGSGGVQELGPGSLDTLARVPATGYLTAVSPRDSTAAALARWYAYSWTSHVLAPHPRVYAVRTADGRYAALEMVGYYCPGAEPGCPTFRYVYQGSGSVELGRGWR